MDYLGLIYMESHSLLEISGCKQSSAFAEQVSLTFHCSIFVVLYVVLESGRECTCSYFSIF
jgi:hypothetical protein